VLEEYPGITNDDIAQYGGKLVQLSVDKDAIPVFCRARSVSYA